MPGKHEAARLPVIALCFVLSVFYTLLLLLPHHFSAEAARQDGQLRPGYAHGGSPVPRHGLQAPLPRTS